MSAFLPAEIHRRPGTVATLVKLHQRIVVHMDRPERALELPPPKPASRRRKR